MAINDARAKQALYMSKKPMKSGSSGSAVSGVLRGKAILWLALIIAGLAGAIWVFCGML